MLTVVVAVVALGGCGRQMRAQQAAAVHHHADRTCDARHGLRHVAAEAGDRRRDDGAPEEAAGDRRRPRRQPRPRHARLRRQRRLRGQHVAGQGFRRARRPISKCVCRSPTNPSLTVGGDNVPAKPLEYTKGTPPEGVSGPLVPARVEDTPGCTASDYDGLPVAGAVVLVDRGKCPFGAKQAVAAERGAVALIVANNEDGDEMGGTLGEKTDVKIPVISVTRPPARDCGPRRAPPRSSSTPVCATSARATSSPKPRPAPPRTW